MSQPNPERLPLGWAAPALSEIASINPPLDRCLIDDDIEVTFVPMRAVEAEGGGLTAPETRRFGEVKKGYTAFLSGDVIMAKITPCMENGKTTVVPDVPGEVCFGSTEFHFLRPEEGVSANWIAQFLLRHDTRRLAQRQMTGGVGQMRVPASFLESLQIPLAPTDEQTRITDMLDELFSDLDAGIAALERVREKLKLYRASVLKAAVEGALSAEWRAQQPHTEPASELLKRILAERRHGWEEDQLAKFKSKGQEPPKNWKAKYKEPIAPDIGNLPHLPVGWCWTTVEQLTTGLMNGYGKRSQAQGKPCIVLRLADIANGEISYEDVRRINCTDNEIHQYALGENDLLILRVNGSPDLVGRIILVRTVANEVLFCDHFIRAQAVVPKLAKWLRINGDSQRFRSLVDLKKVSTAGQNTISQGVLAPFAIPLAPLAEQEILSDAVEDQYSVIDHLEADLNAKLMDALALRQSILRHAFIGYLVPQDPNDEPASELLKRIAEERELRAHEANAMKQANKKLRKPRATRQPHEVETTEQRES